MGLLDRKANPQRYRFSSATELVRINVSNYRNLSLHIWTQVGDEHFENIQIQIDLMCPKDISANQITDEKFVNVFFELQKQVNGKQTDLLGVAFILAAEGPTEVHVGTGEGAHLRNCYEENRETSIHTEDRTTGT